MGKKDLARSYAGIRLTIECLVFWFLLGCGSFSIGSSQIFSIDPAATQCTGNSAQIQVGDGFLRILCGCTDPGETPGTVLPVPSDLTCHLASSQSMVFFTFMGNVLRHQIVSTDPNLPFVPSPISDPSDLNQSRAHVIKFDKPASVYSFEDIFSGMRGQIFVP